MLKGILFFFHLLENNVLFPYQDSNILNRLNIKDFYKSKILEGCEDGDIPEFLAVTTTTGRVGHKYFDSQYFYGRKRVETDGRACFTCSVQGCPVKFHAKYESKDMSNGDQEPIITT